MIYLDHNATSPMLAEVRAAMEPWLGVPANPASVHRAGQVAAAAVEVAREQVAMLVGGVPRGVVFTSGATEANHLFIRGVFADDPSGVHALSPLEHPCVHAASAVVAAAGATQHVLPVDASGRVVVHGLPPDTRLVSVMAANHETGVIQDLDAARASASAVGAALHVDATQAAGRMALSLAEVDGVVLSSHKLGGPGGVGALVLPHGDDFPALFAGTQERGRRGGTVATALVVGFGVACALAHTERHERTARYEGLSHTLRAGLASLGGRIVGRDAPRLVNTTCVVFPGIRGESVVQALDLRDICVSAGAACASGSVEDSAVLRAMGDPEPGGVVRISLGPGSTEAEIDALLAALPAVIASLQMAAEWDV